MDLSLGLVGQGWLQLGELLLSFVLAAVVGLEREMHHKSAGLRTYSLVGVSSALFMLVSKYGFMGVLGDHVVLDPSRVAAQIVSGIGFIGGGVIFMRRNVVRGLTTAASVWLTSALGMACGAGLPVLAVATTVGYFLIMFVYPRIVSRLLPIEQPSSVRLRIGFRDKAGRLTAILAMCNGRHVAIRQVEVERGDVEATNEELEDLTDKEGSEAGRTGEAILTLTLEASTSSAIVQLVARLGELEGVLRVDSLEAAEDALE
ncbi:putative Mg2+ transporter-C (MgtC) family protein [Arboricoccus pini]|uniref:Protein MgtC n=1 Tax=Arboricoccus pini TaxID=1963835 RepID=A0A212S4K8_9PROT|nr:MgtC/SapB family protein [Arboricoccus pini]SNB80113.1 putative Mg2+ transporter-C (MgtC) family protein [Arboricoccus pini]